MDIERGPRVKVKFDRSTLKTQLFGLHQLGAALSHTPAVAITPGQADALGESLADICEHYGLTASKEVMLWISLGATCAGIYGPKIVPVVLRMKATPKAPRSGNGAPVSNLRSVPTAEPSLQVDPSTGVPIPDGGKMAFG